MPGTHQTTRAGAGWKTQRHPSWNQSVQSRFAIAYHLDPYEGSAGPLAASHGLAVALRTWREQIEPVDLFPGAGRARDSADHIQRLELILKLNPNDNQGMRMPLSRRYLEADRFEDALRLAEQYPDDFPEMSYNRVLALYALGHIEKAEK